MRIFWGKIRIFTLNMMPNFKVKRFIFIVKILMCTVKLGVIPKKLCLCFMVKNLIYDNTTNSDKFFR